MPQPLDHCTPYLSFYWNHFMFSALLKTFHVLCPFETISCSLPYWNHFMFSSQLKPFHVLCPNDGCCLLAFKFMIMPKSLSRRQDEARSFLQVLQGAPQFFFPPSVSGARFVVSVLCGWYSIEVDVRVSVPHHYMRIHRCMRFPV
jgi:hypothetical protein